MNLSVPVLLHIHQIQIFCGSIADLAFGQLFDFQSVADIFPDGHVGEQGVVLEHKADVSLFRGRGVDADSIHQDVPFGSGDESGNDSQKGGFAAAGWPS